MIYLTKLGNYFRHKFHNTLLGNVIHGVTTPPQDPHIRIVAATRLSKEKFWSQSALGSSLKAIQNTPNLSVQILFENTLGLPVIYNNALNTHSQTDILVFLHDDVWITDQQFIEKIKISLRRFDIVGVAGNTRISRKQPAWCFHAKVEDGFVWDVGYLSGAVGHGNPGSSKLEVFGPTPARCQLLDGLLIACRRDVLLRSHVQFDERFDFHFYDLDLCRSARRAGLWLGTWPIDVIHQSTGAFGSPQWEVAWSRYLDKWKH